MGRTARLPIRTRFGPVTASVAVLALLAYPAVVARARAGEHSYGHPARAPASRTYFSRAHPESGILRLSDLPKGRYDQFRLAPTKVSYCPGAGDAEPGVGRYCAALARALGRDRSYVFDYFPRIPSLPYVQGLSIVLPVGKSSIRALTHEGAILAHSGADSMAPATVIGRSTTPQRAFVYRTVADASQNNHELAGRAVVWADGRVIGVVIVSGGYRTRNRDLAVTYARRMQRHVRDH